MISPLLQFGAPPPQPPTPPCDDNASSPWTYQPKKMMLVHGEEPLLMKQEQKRQDDAFLAHLRRFNAIQGQQEQCGNLQTSFCIIADESREEREDDDIRKSLSNIVEERDVALRRLDRLDQKVQEALATVEGLRNREKSKRDEQQQQIRKLVFDYLPTKSTPSPTLSERSLVTTETKNRIGPFHIGKILGNGSYGDVFEATKPRVSLVYDEQCDRPKLTTYAIKKMDKRHFLTPRKQENLKRELEILQQVNHHNVVRCHQVLHGVDHIYIVLNKAETDLFEYTLKYDLEEEDLKVIMGGILEGLAYLHAQRISHLNIKPENVLMLREVPPSELTTDDIQLCDFGHAVQHENSSVDLHNNGNSSNVFGWKGTFSFMAPELIATERANGYEADMWSCGVTLLELVLHDLPLGWPSDPERHFTTFLDRITEGMENATPAVQCSDEDSCWDLIQGLLEWVPNRRITAEEALNHEWFNENGESSSELARRF